MFFEIYEQLCNEHNEKPYILPMKLGAKSNSIVAQWKNGSVPRSAMLQKIADYFDVSVAYLLGYEETKKEPATNGDELDATTKELRDIWESADEDERKALLEMARLIKKRRG